MGGCRGVELLTYLTRHRFHAAVHSRHDDGCGSCARAPACLAWTPPPTCSVASTARSAAVSSSPSGCSRTTSSGCCGDGSSSGCSRESSSTTPAYRPGGNGPGRASTASDRRRRWTAGPRSASHSARTGATTVRPTRSRSSSPRPSADARSRGTSSAGPGSTPRRSWRTSRHPGAGSSGDPGRGGARRARSDPAPGRRLPVPSYGGAPTRRGRRQPDPRAPEALADGGRGRHRGWDLLGPRARLPATGRAAARASGPVASAAGPRGPTRRRLRAVRVGRGARRPAVPRLGRPARRRPGAGPERRGRSGADRAPRVGPGVRPSVPDRGADRDDAADQGWTGELGPCDTGCEALELWKP